MTLWLYDVQDTQLQDLGKTDMSSKCIVSQRERENNEVLKECNIKEREWGGRQTAFINSICFCKRVWLCDLSGYQPSFIIFTHYARADKIQGGTCLREQVNNKWILGDFVNLVLVSEE